MYFENFLKAWATCSANSLVGTKTKAWIPFPGSHFWIIPQLNANVFPEPVLDQPITSFPLITNGIAFSWISVGASKCNSSIYFNNDK